jgi:hypothetical protein
MIRIKRNWNVWKTRESDPITTRDHLSLPENLAMQA